MEGRRNGEKLGGIEREETITRIYSMRKKFIINKNTIKQKSRKIITIITNIVYFFRYIYIQREFCTYTQE